MKMDFISLVRPIFPWRGQIDKTKNEVFWMRTALPHSPFSTPLSGSAREVEGRIRNIFQYKKQRPPLLILLLAAALALFCGSLVSCQTDVGQSEPAESASAELPTQARLTRLLAEVHGTAASDAQMVFSQEGDSCVLAAALMDTEDSGDRGGDLLLGLWDGTSQDWLGPVYTIPGSAGMCSSWTESDGSLHLLCSNAAEEAWVEQASQVFHFRFQGRTLENLGEWDNQQGYKAVPIPGALELYTRNPDYTAFQPQSVQWVYSHTLSFTQEPVDPVPPAVREAARAYQVSEASWSGRSSAVSTAIFQLEEAVRWDDLSALELSPQWQGREGLSLVCYQFSFCSPEEYFPLRAQLVFLQNGDEFFWVGDFMDYSFENLNDPKEMNTADLSAADGLAPYNWCALQALYEAGALTRIPSFAEQFSRRAAARLIWDITADHCRDTLEASVYTPYEPPEGTPEEGALRLDGLEPLYQRSMGNEYSCAVYTLESSQYQNGRWRSQAEQMVFCTADDRWGFHLDASMKTASSVTDLDRAAQEHYYGLEDLEVAVWDDSVSPAAPIGPGLTSFWFLTSTETQYDQEGYAIAERGDRYSAQFSVDAQGRRWVELLDTARRLPTIRGVRVGDSRAQVEAAYPELRRDPYPGYEGDYLWYCRQEDGSGPAMLFFFQGDQLTRLVLIR